MPATFTIAPSGASVPFKPDHAAGLADRGLRHRTDHVLVAGNTTSFEVLRHRLAGDGHAVAMQQSAVEQRLQQHRACRRPRACPSRRICRPASGRRCRASPEDLRHVVQVNSMPASCAIAGRCSAALVEPPVAATTTAAFSSAFAGARCRAGADSGASSSITARPSFNA